MTQSRKEGHYGQTQFGHDCNSLTNFGGSYIFPTNNTKGNFQNKDFKAKKARISRLEFTRTWSSKMDDDQSPQS